MCSHTHIRVFTVFRILHRRRRHLKVEVLRLDREVDVDLSSQAREVLRFVQRRCHGPRVGAGPGVVAGPRIMQISNITDATSNVVLITHECMKSNSVIM